MAQTRTNWISASAMVLALGLAAPLHARESDHATLERGRYLVRAGDCEACHTDEGSEPFAGGRAIPTPFGTIYSTNITPDKETGIGAWTDEDFYKAMHEGIGPNGRHYYPAFPYPWFTRVSRADVIAMRRYLETLQPVKHENKRTELPWPLSWRGGMTVWNGMYFDEGEFRPDSAKSAQWNRGAYLVEGLSHCGACHTPKNVLGSVKHDERFQGGYGEHWFAPNLTANDRGGLGRWSAEELVQYLKTGATSHTAAAGPMAEVIQHSTHYLNENDLQAIATYLKDLKPGGEGQPGDAPDEKRLGAGQAIYVDQCAGCHMENGEGLAHVFPSLKGSSAIQARDPATLLRVVLEGGAVVATDDKPTAFAMPGFDNKLSDGDIANVITYIRNAWGNRASAVKADQVAEAREQVRKSVVQDGR
ncbi:MAG TPA: c-type cytochrome [Burkholderiales bacterium]|nr:c-type cytochrome [Burkholderiales bacterium]